MVALAIFPSLFFSPSTLSIHCWLKSLNHNKEKWLVIFCIQLPHVGLFTHRHIFFTTPLYRPFPLFIYLFTYSTEQSPSWEGNWFSASQKIPRILWKPKVHYRVYKSRHLPYSKQISAVHASIICLQVIYSYKRSVDKISVLHIYIYFLATPLQAWTGPEGSRRLRLPDFKTIGTWRW